MVRLRTGIVLLALLAVCAVAAPGAEAVSEGELRGLTFQDLPGFRTLLVDVQGEEHWRDGALEVSGLEDCFGALASCHLYYEGESILDVELRPMEAAEGGEASLFGTTRSVSNGYYAVQFDVNSSQQAFLTGLTWSDLSSVQSSLISARQNNTAFEMTDVDFIDAEKMDPSLGGQGIDSDMCWAAACANVLHYTGWAVRADEVHNFTGEGFTDGDKKYHEDRLFNSFVSFFQDAGGSAYAGLTWFFSGINPARGSGSAQVDNGSYGDLAGFLYPYAPDPLIRNYAITGWGGKNHCQDIVPVLDRLREGWGCTLSVGWYEKSGSRYYRNGGHTITLWGYIRNKTFASDGNSLTAQVNPNDYVAFLVTDSDSDKYGRTSRGYFDWTNDASNAPNKLQLSNLSYVGFTNSRGETECTWQMMGYSESIGLVEDFTLLQPYSDSIPQENWDRAHADRFRADTPEASAFLRISDEDNAAGRETTVFLAKDGGTARVNLFWGAGSNLCDWSQEHSVRVQLWVTDNSGRVVLSDEGSISGKFCTGGYTYYTSNLDLPGGNYKATVSVSLTDGWYEAFYTNNTATWSFTVIDAAQRGFKAKLTGASGWKLQTYIECQELFEYCQYGYCYLEDGQWSDWVWGPFAESVSGMTITIPARKADRVCFRLDLHREYQNYTLLSEQVPLSFTAALDPNGGSVSPTSFQTYAGMAYSVGLSDSLPTPVRSDYRFDGWYTARIGGSQVTGATRTNACGNETLYAHWSCILTLDPDGGTLSDSGPVYVPQGSACGSLPSPTRPFYYFAGWYAPDGRKVEEGTEITHSMTLTAKWNFWAFFNVPSDVTDAPESLRLREGDPVGAADDLVARYGGKLPVPKRQDYRFDGWFTSEGRRVTEETIAQKATHKYLYAHWTYKWAVSARVVGTNLEYDVLVMDSAPAHLFLAAYDGDGRMIFSRMLPYISSGIGTAAVPATDHYKAFLVHSGSCAPMCPAWDSNDPDSE